MLPFNASIMGAMSFAPRFRLAEGTKSTTFFFVFFEDCLSEKLSDLNNARNKKIRNTNRGCLFLDHFLSTSGRTSQVPYESFLLGYRLGL